MAQTIMLHRLLLGDAVIETDTLHGVLSYTMQVVGIVP
jgi:hypothetical protein